MRAILIAAVFAAALSAAAPAHAQALTSPPPGSSERKAVLDTIRPLIEEQLGSPVEFVVSEIRLGGGWAFVRVTPQRPGGRAIRNPEPDSDGVHTEAILRREGGRWEIKAWAIGSTDVWWVGWCGRVPTGLMGPVCEG